MTNSRRGASVDPTPGEEWAKPPSVAGGATASGGTDSALSIAAIIVQQR
ncbi:hypothetical protein [Mycobacterium sp. 050134]